MPCLYPRVHFIATALQIKERVQESWSGCGLLLHHNRDLIYDLQGWELYDEIHRRQRVKLPIRVKQQIVQMYFNERKAKDWIAAMFNVSRRTVCRVLAEWNEIRRAFRLLENQLCTSEESTIKEISIKLNRLLILLKLPEYMQS